MKFVVFTAYRVDTTAREGLRLLFRGWAGRRLWFSELDAPFGDMYLRPEHIVNHKQIGANGD